MKDSKPIRTFLAIDIPLSVREQIGVIQAGLKRNINSVRWIKPEGMHITLKFFGSISEDDVRRICKVIAGITAERKLFKLQMEQVGGFPHIQRARVIWLGINGDTHALIELQGRVEEELSLCGFPQEKRRFVPHLTLGRNQMKTGFIEGLEKVIEKAGMLQTDSFQVEGLKLYRSDLRPEGAVYTELAYFPFKR